jgi:hypothetical protein
MHGYLQASCIEYCQVSEYFWSLTHIHVKESTEMKSVLLFLLSLH